MVSSGYTDSAPFRIVPDETAEDRVRIIRMLASRGAAAPIVRRLAALARHRAGPDAGPRALATEALRVTQRAGYVPAVDPYLFQSAAYTALNGGDCEDLTPLLAAILAALGIASEVVWLSQPDRTLNHVVLQVAIDGEWLWADPSVCGARLGEDPYDAIERLGAWYVLDATQAGGACAVE